MLALFDRVMVGRRIAAKIAEATWAAYVQGWLHSSYVWGAVFVSGYLFVKIRNRLR